MTEERTPAAAPRDGAASAAVPEVMARARQDTAADGNGDAAPDWRDALPMTLRRVAEKFPTPGDVVKSYAELERRLGRSITIPDGDATEAEIAGFYSCLGRPESPEGYSLTVPDGVPDHLAPGPESAPARAAFLAAMHEAGATPDVVQAAYGWYYRAATEADAASRLARDRADADADAALRRDWGRDYDRNAALAARTLKSFGDDELNAAVQRAGLARHPAWLRALARIGRATSEDRLLTEGKAAPADNARRRIDAIMEAHFGKPSYADAAVQSELRGLYGALYGNATPEQGGS